MIDRIELENFKKDLEEVYSYLQKLEVNKNNFEEELQTIEKSIQKHTEDIEELKKKLENMDNYQLKLSEFSQVERPIVEELLDESFEKQGYDLGKDKNNYQNFIDSTKIMIEQQQRNIDEVMLEIKNIEEILNKDEVAKKRNIAKNMHLSAEQVDELRKNLLIKEKQVQLIEEEMNSNYDKIKLYQNNIDIIDKKLEEVSKKRERLEIIVDNKNKIERDVDYYHLRLDQDKLCKLEAGLNALNERKLFLEFDSLKKIEDLIEKVDSQLKKFVEEENILNNNSSFELDTAKDNIDEGKIVEQNKLDNDEKLVEFESLPNDDTDEVLDVDNEQKNDEKKDNLIEKENKSLREVVNVKSAKEFLKKHKKVILIAGGLTAMALLAQPVIIPAIMHANSVLWHASFVQAVPALQSFLHSCNLALGNVIGASYVGGSGLWTAASGAFINFNAAQASILTALATHALSLGVVGVSAKKLIEKIKNDRNKKSDIESMDEKNTDKEDAIENKKEKLEKWKEVINSIDVPEMLVDNGGNTL